MSQAVADEKMVGIGANEYASKSLLNAILRALMEMQGQDRRMQMGIIEAVLTNNFLSKDQKVALERRVASAGSTLHGNWIPVVTYVITKRLANKEQRLMHEAAF